MTQEHYDYRLRVSVKKAQTEAATLKFLKGTGSATLPEAYRVVLALQSFYGTEAAAAEGSAGTRQTALESIGLLLEQCVVIADQSGIDLDSLTCEPAVLSDLLKQAAERLDPLRRSRRRVRIKESAPTAATNGRASVIADSTPQPVVRVMQPDVQPEAAEEPEPTQAPTPAQKPKRERMF